MKAARVAGPRAFRKDFVDTRLFGRLELFEMAAYIPMETPKSGQMVPTRFA